MVIGSRRTALGMRDALSRLEMATAPNCSRVVPYRCMWRRASMAKSCPGATNPVGVTKSQWLPLLDGAANAAVVRLVRCWLVETVTTTDAMPARTAAAAAPIAPAEPPPPPVTHTLHRRFMPSTWASTAESIPAP